MTNYTDIKSYIEFYRSVKNPGYAVLIAGEWGVGKTFQVKNSIPKDKSCYVSLFGIERTAEIFEAVFLSMYPLKSTIRSGVNNAKSASVGIAGFGSIPLGTLAAGIAGVFIRDQVDPSKVIIFDDLERCSAPIEGVLGAINRYVEHHKSNVIVIAHDEKFLAAAATAKEKIFGKTLRVEPDIEAAYEAFSRNYTDEKDERFLRSQRENIVGTFKQSTAPSLRIFRQIIDDNIRLLSLFEPNQIENKEAVNEIICLFSALNIEFRLGNLESKDLESRREAHFSYMVRSSSKKESDVEPPPISKAMQKHKNIKLDSIVISDKFIARAIHGGIYDKTLFQEGLKDSVYFRTPESTPAWKRLYAIDQSTEAEVEAAIRDLNDQFDNREITEVGEIFHLFASMFMMSHYNLSNDTSNDVLLKCKAYIDDLEKLNTLLPFPMRNKYDEFDLANGYGNYGYWIMDDYRTLFSDATQYLKEKRLIVREKILNERARDVLKHVTCDAQTFFQLLNPTAHQNDEFSEVPILSKIAPKDFVAAWTSTHPSNLYWIRVSLEERFKRIHHYPDLETEIEWWSHVKTIIGTYIETATPIKKFQLSRSMPKFDPLANAI